MSASGWGIQMMLLGQLEACFCLIQLHRPNSLMVEHWTGGAKTHKLLFLGVIERGIVLIFIPLLTLSTNVMHKFKSVDPTWGNVGIYSLDILFDCNRSAYNQLLCCCFGQTTTLKLFLFLSPQFLINHPNVFGKFINSLTAIDARERQIFYEHLWCVVTRRIFIRSQS